MLRIEQGLSRLQRGGGSVIINADGSINIVGVATFVSTPVVAATVDPTITIKSEDASLTTDQALGSLDFFGTDASGGGAGVRAAIQVESIGATGSSYRITLYADDGAGLVESGRFGGPLTGSTLVGGLIVGGTLGISRTASDASLTISGNAGQNQNILFQTAGVNRWFIKSNSDAESGSNVGSDMEIFSRNDGGGSIGTALKITRATLQSDFGGNLTVAAGKFIAIGLGPAQSGDLRLANAGTIRSRNAAGTGNLLLVQGNAADEVEIASASLTTRIAGNTIIVGTLDIVKDNGALFLKAATSTNAEMFFVVNDVNQFRIGTEGATNTFRIRDEVIGANRISISASGTVTIGGNLEVRRGGSLANFVIDADADQNKQISIQSAGVNRWLFVTIGSETGSDVGTDLHILARGDDGSNIGAAIIIERATKDVTFGNDIALAANKNILLGGDVALVRGAANRLDLASGDSFNVIAGDITVDGEIKSFRTTATAKVIVAANAGQARDFTFRSVTTDRWTIRVNTTAESGSDAGSNLEFLARADTGAAIGTALSITRATMAATFGANLTVSGILAVAGATTFSAVPTVSIGSGGGDVLIVKAAGQGQWQFELANHGSGAGEDLGLYVSSSLTRFIKIQNKGSGALILNVGGVIEAESGIVIKGGAGEIGQIYKSATHGTALWSNIGSSNDFILFNGAGATVLNVPTGTPNVVMAGTLTVAGTSNLSGNVGLGIGPQAVKLAVQETTSATGISTFFHNHASAPRGLIIDFTGAAPDDRSIFFLRMEDSAGIKSTLWSDGGADFAGALSWGGGPAIASSALIADYAGISAMSNSTATVIPLVNSWVMVSIYDTDSPEAVSNGDHTADKITIGGTGDYQIAFDTAASAVSANQVIHLAAFDIAASGATITAATAATPVVVTAAGHGLSNGQRVKIAGVGGMVELNDRIFTVAGVSGDDFNLQDDGAVDINGTGFTAFTSGGTAARAIDTLVHSIRKYATGGDVGSQASSNIAALIAGNTIELFTKNVTGTSDLTIEESNFFIHRLG